MTVMTRGLFPLAAAFLFAAGVTNTARASDHLDSPATVANPQADIADVYAWIVDRRPAPEPRHDDSGSYASRTRSNTPFMSTAARAFGHTTRVDVHRVPFRRCERGQMSSSATLDSASGDPTNPAGLEGRNHRFRVYAAPARRPVLQQHQGASRRLSNRERRHQERRRGRRRGLRAFRCGDHEGDPRSDEPHRRRARAESARQLDGLGNRRFRGPERGLAGAASCSRSGARHPSAGKQIDRMARPFVANTLLGVAPFSTDDASGLRRQEFNEAPPANGARFIDGPSEIARIPGFAGRSMRQPAARRQQRESPSRYRALAKVFADDRLWVNSASSVCTQFFAVELASLAGTKAAEHRLRRPGADLRHVQRVEIAADRRHHQRCHRRPAAGRAPARRRPCFRSSRRRTRTASITDAPMERGLGKLVPLGLAVRMALAAPSAVRRGSRIGVAPFQLPRRRTWARVCPVDSCPASCIPSADSIICWRWFRSALWGAFLGRPLIYVLPVVFPAMMVVGAILGMFGVAAASGGGRDRAFGVGAGRLHRAVGQGAGMGRIAWSSPCSRCFMATRTARNCPRRPTRSATARASFSSLACCTYRESASAPSTADPMASSRRVAWAASSRSLGAWFLYRAIGA